MANKKPGQTPITWDPRNVFAGTAWYYARYRPGYPEKLFGILIDKFRLDKKSRVLDLGCGTGQVALRIALYVSKVIAIDPQEDMLKEGRALASASKIGNIIWLNGESGQLKDLAKEIGEVDLTVMAWSFHWMDRVQTLRDLYRITKPGGGIVVVAGTNPRYQPDVPWINAIDETVKRWLGEVRKAGTTGTFARPQKLFEDNLKESEFTGLEKEEIHIKRQWTIDRIIGYQYSTSMASLPVLGDKKEAFEADLRKRLKEIEPAGVFEEKAVVQVLMAWKS